MADPDYSAWRTKRQAAAEIGCSTKTVEKLAHDRAIQQATWHRARGQAVVVYDPDDVARVASARRQAPPGAFVVPGPPIPSNGRHGMAPTTGEATADRVVTALVAIVETVLRRVGLEAAKAEKPSQLVLSPPSQPAPQPMVLTLDEAALVSGLTRTYLLRRIKAGTLPAIKDRHWKIRRKDLEQV